MKTSKTFSDDKVSRIKMSRDGNVSELQAEETNKSKTNLSLLDCEPLLSDIFKDEALFSSSKSR